MGSEQKTENKFAAIINEKLNSGELTRKEASRRLEFAIEREFEKSPEEIRHGFIDTCEDLLYALNSPEEYVSRAASSKQQLEVKLARKRNFIFFGRRLALTISMGVLFFVAIAVFDGILYREWLTGNSTEDMQQYELSGYVVDPNLVEKGNASSDQEFREIITSNLEEAMEILSSVPLLPQWHPEKWEEMLYYASADDMLEWFYIDYVSSETTYVMKYEIFHYLSADMAQESIEQNQHGYKTLCNGWEVYFTENMDRSVAIWIEGTTVYTVHGPVPQDEIVKMIQSIEREKRHNE